MFRPALLHFVPGAACAIASIFVESPVKLNCPICSVMLNLDDNFAKKLVRCPKCEQSFVVPAVAPTVAERIQNAPIAPPSDEFELSPSAKEPTLAPESLHPNALKFCPGCGAQWKKGTIECNACHYVPALGAQIKPKAKERFNLLQFDLGSVYWVLFLGALGYGGWYLFTHWNSVAATIRSIFPS